MSVYLRTDDGNSDHKVEGLITTFIEYALYVLYVLLLWNALFVYNYPCSPSSMHLSGTQYYISLNIEAHTYDFNFKVQFAEQITWESENVSQSDDYDIILVMIMI